MPFPTIQNHPLHCNGCRVHRGELRQGSEIVPKKKPAAGRTVGGPRKLYLRCSHCGSSWTVEPDELQMHAYTISVDTLAARQ